jgi:hypothetical protein
MTEESSQVWASRGVAVLTIQPEKTRNTRDMDLQIEGIREQNM